MLGTAVSTAFQKNLAFGQIAESDIARWLRNRGAVILPVYDIEYDTGKGPRLFAPGGKQIVAPDLYVFPKNGGACWVEAKHKTVFSWYRIGSYWVTGIDLHHYREYRIVRERLGRELWLMFLHRSDVPGTRDLPYAPGPCPTGLFAGELQRLIACESHTSDRWGNHGMVYWAESSLQLLATLKQFESAAT